MTEAVFPVGTKVWVPDAESYMRRKASLIRNRVGVVTKHTAFKQWPIVVFPKGGRRKEYSEAFEPRYLAVTELACPYADALVAELKEKANG